MQCLTQQITEIKAKSQQARQTVELLAAKEKEEHEREVAAIRASFERSSADLERVRSELSAAKKRLSAAAAGKRCPSVADSINDLGRGVELATRSAQELTETRQALKTCVRMYQDLQSVYHSAE